MSTPDTTPFNASFPCPDCGLVLSNPSSPCPACGLVPERFKGHLREKRSRRRVPLALGLLAAVLLVPILPVLSIVMALATVFPGSSNLEPLRYLRSVEHRREVHAWWRRKGVFQAIQDIGSHILFAVFAVATLVTYFLFLSALIRDLRHHTFPHETKRFF